MIEFLAQPVLPIFSLLLIFTICVSACIAMCGVLISRSKAHQLQLAKCAKDEAALYAEIEGHIGVNRVLRGQNAKLQAEIEKARAELISAQNALEGVKASLTQKVEKVVAEIDKVEKKATRKRAPVKTKASSQTKPVLSSTDTAAAPSPGHAEILLATSLPDPAPTAVAAPKTTRTVTTYEDNFGTSFGYTSSSDSSSSSDGGGSSSGGSD